MELRQYIATIKRRKWIIIAMAVVFTSLAVVITLLSTPQYVSQTTLRVSTVENITYTQLLMNTYARIVTSGTVKSQVSEELGLSGAPNIRVELVPNTELMIITAEAPDSQEAQAIAATAAQLLADQSREIYSGTGQTTTEILAAQLEEADRELTRARTEYDDLLTNSPGDTVAVDAINQSISLKERTYATLLEQYEKARVNEALLANSVSVVEPASLPAGPAKPNRTVNIALGVLLGLVGGTLLAFVVDNLDTRMYSTEQIEAVTRLPTVGTIPATKSDLQIARLNNGYYPQIEAFRRLRTNLVSLDRDHEKTVLMVTSAQRGEGKSTVAANLAVTISQSGRKVIIVDCDMRLPTIHKLFELPNKRGLTSVLTGEVDLDDAVLSSSYPRLSVLASGPLPPNPTELLGAERMVQLIEVLRQEFDYVLLDTPALLSVADAAVLVPNVDDVIWVVAKAKTRRSDVESVRRQLINVGANSIEVVINYSELDSDYTAYAAESDIVSE